MMPLRRSMRGVLSDAFRAATTLAAVLVAGVFAWILITLLWRGIGSLSWASITSAAEAARNGHPGLAHAMAGSALVALLACLVSVPIGLVAGVFLAELGRKGPLLSAVHFAAHVLSGVPSVVVGVCVVLLLERAGLGLGLMASVLALAVLMVPMLACATAHTLNATSPALREAAMALGTPPWRILLQVSLRAAAPGILSAGLLAVAKVAGEVAPLLLVMPSSQGSMPTLQVETYRLLLSPDEPLASLAWTAAMLLTIGVAVIVLVAHRLGREVR